MDGTVFAFDPDWVSTLNAPFMTNAFLAGLCIALAAGVMGSSPSPDIPHSQPTPWHISDCQVPPEPYCSVCLFPQVLACSLSAEHW